MRNDRDGRSRLRLVAALAATSLLTLAGCAVGSGRGDYRPPSDPASLSPVAQDDTVSPQAAPASPTPTPRPTPINHCLGNTSAQLVLVDIGAQHAWFCAGTRAVYNTAVTTGMDKPDTQTPLGRFHIQSKNTDTTLVPSTGVPYPVKYWIPFQAPLYGFHDSSWQHFPYGSPQYRTAGSHGCVHMPLAAMRYLYRWAHIGAAVDISA